MSAQRYIGLMSGTSLDAIDVAIAEISSQHFQLLAGEAYPLPPVVREQILALSQPSNNEIDRLGVLDIKLGELFATCVREFMAKQKLAPHDIRAIGSHGQTIRHRPEQHFTLQIGDPNIIATHTGITTVADFRRRDMSLGGQGAPLVPAFHQAMFQSSQAYRVIVNIGGMANITWLSVDPTESIIGYDTGPGNVLLDAWITHNQQKAFDRQGQWAASGTIHNELLQQLLTIDYFQQLPPKSTGREQFNLDWLLSQLQHYGQSIPAQDVQTTLAELTALTITQEIKRHSSSTNLELYVCGGGAHNTYLMSRLDALLQPAILADTSVLGLSPDWIEAGAFAWLAYRNLMNMSGNCPEVTGATQPTLLGGIYPAY